MKNTIKFLGIIAIVAIIGFGVVSCGGDDDKGGNTGTGTAPAITTTSLPNGKVNTAYSQTLAASGTAPITWSLDSGTLPTGLTLNATTGVISGTPTTATTSASAFTVKATNAAGSGTKELSITISIEMVMVQVAGGSFQMGKELGTAGSDITPVHTVTLTGFSMGKYPVTQEQYQAVMGNNPSDFNGATGKEPAEGETQGKRPVEGVTWYDAVEFCNKLSEREGLQTVYAISGRTPATGYPITGATVMAAWGQNGYRLPTEAQWEYAAKGGSTQGNFTYAGSNTLGDVAWYAGNSGNKTHEVGKKTANGLGLYDMTGNVWELCWDWKGDYSNGTQTTPIGPDTGTTWVMRGGCWSDAASDDTICLVFRGTAYPNAWTNAVGFRIVKP